MSTNDESRTGFETFLQSQDESDWAETIEGLLPEIHEVDRAATRIWFAFYPLRLLRAIEQAEDPEEFARKLLLQGNYLLKDQIDSSHTFLYGHRFWPEVKRAAEDYATQFESKSELKLIDAIRDAARLASTAAKMDESLLKGITAVA